MPKVKLAKHGMRFPFSHQVWQGARSLNWFKRTMNLAKLPYVALKESYRPSVGPTMLSSLAFLRSTDEFQQSYALRLDGLIAWAAG